MADTTPDTVVKLPEAVIQRLKDMEMSIAEAERGAEVMKKLGMDVSSIEEKISWSKEVRDTLLKEFA